MPCDAPTVGVSQQDSCGHMPCPNMPEDGPKKIRPDCNVTKDLQFGQECNGDVSSTSSTGGDASNHADPEEVQVQGWHGMWTMKRP